MLRLWPEQITVGLFAGHCWLRRRGKSSALQNSRQVEIGALVQAFDALLEQAAPLRGARLDLIVSDRVARITALPWQVRLHGKAEWQAYARASFDANGMPLDQEQICVPAVRRYGEQGLALALPVAWLAELEETAHRHGGRLRTVMPLSAAAYWSPRRWMPSKGAAWILLEDEGSASLLCFDGRRSVAHDTQPALDGRGLRQLLQRHLLTSTPSQVAVWGAGSTSEAAILQAIGSDVSIHKLSHDYWDRHA